MEPAAELSREILSRVAQPFQLPRRHNAVLPRGQRRYLMLNSPFVPHTGDKGDSPARFSPGEHLFACVESM